MKKILVSFLVVLVGLSLTACGSNNKQAKENSSLKAQNSSLKAKKQQRENSSLKAENSSLKNDKQTSTASSNNTSNQEDPAASSNNTSNQEDPACLSNAEVGNRVKTAKGDTSPDYNTIVENHGDGTYDVELRRDAPSGQNSNLIGEYVYNAKTNAITTKFESGLD